LGFQKQAKTCHVPPCFVEANYLQPSIRLVKDWKRYWESCGPGEAAKQIKSEKSKSKSVEENLDEAKSLLNGHPHLGWNAECAIEVHETMPLPGM